MKNGDTTQAYDFCPVHNSEIKKEYSFGRYGDATVITFNGCKCALAFANTGFNDPGQYYTDYSLAASRASMIRAQASARRDGTAQGQPGAYPGKEILR